VEKTYRIVGCTVLNSDKTWPSSFHLFYSNHNDNDSRLNHILTPCCSGARLRPWFDIDGRIYPKPTQSFREMHIKDIVKDVKHWMSFIPYKPVEEMYRVGFMAGLTIPPYELPDGTKINNNERICTAAERWFLSSKSKSSVAGLEVPAPTAVLPTAGGSSSSHKPQGFTPSQEVDIESESLQSLVHLCLSKCDVDVRRDLMANIVIVGGGSLIDGVSNRLSYELNELIPSNMKVTNCFV
jgi:hypothetical protein